MRIRSRPKATLALDKLGHLFNAVDGALNNAVVSKDALRDARKFLYGPLGADDELDDGDRDALIEIARRGIRAHSALLEALGADSEEEDDDENSLQAPGHNPTSKDSQVDHRDDFKSGTAKPTVDSRSGMGLDARRAAALLDVDEIFCGASVDAHAEQAADLSPWG